MFGLRNVNAPLVQRVRVVGLARTLANSDILWVFPFTFLFFLPHLLSDDYCIHLYAS